jgi:limonene-1,2-epoxide hydrolase
MRFAVVTVAVIALTACGGHAASSPESVARAWSAALDRNDNEAAGRLFADGAQVVQGAEIVLQDHADAVQWNALLPCGGTITSVTANGRDQVLVIFKLTERPRHRCDAPGAKAAALFRVHDGKIVLWHQTKVPEEAPTTAAQTV